MVNNIFLEYYKKNHHESNENNFCITLCLFPGFVDPEERLSFANSRFADVQ